MGAVNKALKNTRTRDYWELCAKNQFHVETIHYVPKLVAVSYVLSQPRRFGISCWNGSVEWTSIPLDRQVSLDVLASEAGADRELLKALNAELLRGISPEDADYRLKVPLAHLSPIAEVLARKDLPLIRYYSYVVRKGDTLSALSKHYGVPLSLIERHNPGISSRYLKIGETVIIPAYEEKQPPAPSASRSEKDLSFNGTHVVKKGETLWTLGKRYGVDPEALASANNMKLNQILREGKTLKVPIQ
jgi:membrane-bound lytic murein transglycosylase D